MSKSTTSKTISIFWRYTKRYRLLFSLGTIGAMLGVLLQAVIPPFIVSRAFTQLQIAFGAHQAIQFSQLSGYLIAFTASMVFGLICWRLQGFAVWQYEIRAMRDIIVDIFEHMEQMGQRFHADRFGGALVSQTNKFVSGYEKLMDEFTWSIVTGLTTMIASIGVLLFVSYKFALILIFIIILYIFIMSKRVRHQFPFNRREAELESDRTAALADAITNIGNIRAFANEDYELERFIKAADKSHKAYYDLSIETFKNDSISHTMTNSLRVCAFVFGVYAITNLHQNAGVLYLVVSYSSSIVDRLWEFGRVVRNVNRAIGDSAEMTEILQLLPEVKDPPRPAPSQIHRGEVVFDTVDFYYDDDKQSQLFKSLGFKIKPGEKIGLVGPSGGGKTTITKLLLRFMDIQNGIISIDGQDITTISQGTLRSNITYVAQEPILFHRSIKDNIGYGQLDADDESIEAVAKMANAHEFIMHLSNGYDTMVGERGVKLSGGQRQRIAIARAMLKNAPILVLDEATSALDSESEVLIQDALWKLMEGRTAIVIAHRLSTIQKMDRIIVLDRGVIVEQGSHKELLFQKGVYARLWQHQSGGFIEE